MEPMEKLFQILNGNYADYEIEYRIHATRRMFQRNIHENDVETVLKEGKVIAQYDDDLPSPSFLINGIGYGNRPLHVVVALNSIENILVIITAYRPDPIKWTKQFTRRVK